MYSDPIWMYASVILLILTLMMYIPGIIGAFFYMYYIVQIEKNLDRKESQIGREHYGQLKDGQIEEV